MKGGGIDEMEYEEALIHTRKRAEIALGWRDKSEDDHSCAGCQMYGEWLDKNNSTDMPTRGCCGDGFDKQCPLHHLALNMGKEDCGDQDHTAAFYKRAITAIDRMVDGYEPPTSSNTGSSA